MSEREKINVEMYGQTYTLRVVPEEKEKVLAIAKYVDMMMHKVGDNQGRLDYRDVAVLAAMNLAEEYFKLQREYEEILTIVNEVR
ncbi:MAG: cell division protein ZapA [Peptococcaceae bacterium]|nr:cell division protein ZapA [Peptococcaceae bacterium]MBR2627451.1 cell division protein ZapA [Peptococcaceae bacterium]